MLSLMRKHAQSWLIKFLITIIALVFIFYFGYSVHSDRSTRIAIVNGELISRMEYQKAYKDLNEALRKQYKDLWNDNLAKMFDLKNRALNSLIDQKLIGQEARRLGLNVTDDEIQKEIMNYPAFQINGQFSVQNYKALLSNNRMNPEDFEAEIHRGLLGGKVRQFFLAFAETTDRETLEYYTYNNEKIKIEFVRFKPDQFQKAIKPDQASMKEFFNKNKKRYLVPSKIKIAYLTLDPDDFNKQVKINAQEIKDYYESNKDTFAIPKQVKARHILFDLPQDARGKEEKKVKDKAVTILEKARKGEDFAALAKKYSEGPSKSKGGDLGFFSKGEMTKPFEDAAFKLKKGEISELVRTQFGFHIIKIEEIREAGFQPLEELHDQIVKILTAYACTDIAHEKGLSLLDQMPYEADLSEHASGHGLKTEITDFFSQDDPIPGIDINEKLGQSLFSLNKKETSDLIDLDGKFYLFQVLDKMESRPSEFHEVENKIKVDFTSHLAGIEAKTAAGNLLADLKKGKDWDKLAEEKNLKIEKTDFFSRNASIPEIGNAPGLQETCFSLNKEKRYPDTVFENINGVFVIRWEERKGIDEKELQKKKKEITYKLIEKKHGQTFDNWLENLKNNADIKIQTQL